MTATTIRPTLKKGDSGAAVKELQQLLKQHINVDLTVDGVFGPATEGVVKAFQFTVFLQQDGIVGPITWKALAAGLPVDKPILRRGTVSEDVKRVQNVLKFSVLAQQSFNFNGYYFGAIDGNYGPQTEAAVKAFQKDTRFHAAGLLDDGIVGEKTWNALHGLAGAIIHLAL